MFCLFSFCDFKHYKFLDGGVLVNFPLKEVKIQVAYIVIAFNFKADDIDYESGMMDIAMRTIDIMGNKISEESLDMSDFIVTIQTDKTGLLEIVKLDECYKYGYKAVIEKLPEIKNVLYN